MDEMKEIDVQAADEIKICETGLAELKSDGKKTGEVESLMKIAISLHHLKMYDRSLRFAGRAHRMIVEMKEGMVEPGPNGVSQDQAKPEGDEDKSA